MSTWHTFTLGLLLSCTATTAAAGVGSLKGAISGTDAGSACPPTPATSPACVSSA